MNFPTKEGKDWKIPDELLAELNRTYLNVEHELTKARLWLLACPDRRKTVRGMGRFLANWFSRSGQLRPVTVPVAVRVAELIHEGPKDRTVARAAMQQIKQAIKRGETP